MALNNYQRFAYRRLGPYVERAARSNLHLRLSLKKAHIFLLPEVYLATSYMNMIVAFLAGLAVLGVLAVMLATGLIQMPITALIAFTPLPLVLAFTTYLLTFVTPDLKASERTKDINAKLPYALNFIATMASAGITPSRVFEALGNRDLYGQVAKEAALISRDVNLLGRDMLAALQAAIERTPSIKFQDFLQGAVTALTSGEDLKNYFLTKSEQYVYENRQETKRFIESLAILAESYVTVVVAAPVFLLVVLSVMLMFGGDPTGTLTLGYVIMLILLPMAQAAFALTIKYITPQV